MDVAREPAPLSLAELFKEIPGYTPPDFRYVVLDVNRYPPEELRPVEDVTSGVFLMEQSQDVAELEQVLDELEGVVDDPGLARDIALLVHDVAIKLNLGEEEIPRFENLEEIRMSLLQRAEIWTQQWMAEGETKGQRLGMAKTLKNLLGRRFGDLPEWAVDRIDRADVASRLGRAPVAGGDVVIVPTTSARPELARAAARAPARGAAVDPLRPSGRSR